MGCYDGRLHPTWNWTACSGFWSERIDNAIHRTFVKILLLVDEGRAVVVRAVYPIILLEWDSALGHRMDLKPGSPLLSIVFDQAPIMMRAAQIRN